MSTVHGGITVPILVSPSNHCICLWCMVVLLYLDLSVHQTTAYVYGAWWYYCTYTCQSIKPLHMSMVHGGITVPRLVSPSNHCICLRCMVVLLYLYLSVHQTTAY